MKILTAFTLNNKLNSGLYLLQLTVDGLMQLTEKIIIIK